MRQEDAEKIAAVLQIAASRASLRHASLEEAGEADRLFTKNNVMYAESSPQYGQDAPAVLCMKSALLTFTLYIPVSGGLSLFGHTYALVRCIDRNLVVLRK